MTPKRAARIAVYLFLFFIASIEFISLLHWLLQPFSLYGGRPTLIGLAARLESQVFYAVASVTPVLCTFFMFSWISKPVLNILKVKRLQVIIGARKFILTPLNSASQRRFTNRRNVALILLSSMAAAALLMLYPYSPALNPDCHHVGVDIHYYAAKYLPSLANQTSILQTVGYAFSRFRDRPIGLLLMYAVYRASGLSAWTVAMFSPAVLAPLTVLATYYFSREAGFSQTVACLAAAFTAFSYHLTTGIFAGFLSNWIALIMVYAFSGLLMRSLRLKSGLHGFLAASVMVLVLFTHAWTWGMLMGVTAVFAFLQLFKDFRARRAFPSWNLKLLALILAVNFSANLLRNCFLQLGGKIEVVQAAQAGLSIWNIAKYWSTVNYTFNRYVFRTFLNPLMMLLSLIGALSILKSGGENSEYLVSWPLASSVPFILGSTVIQSRILYNMPISTFAAQGLYAILGRIRGAETNGNGKFNAVAVAITVLFNLNYALRILFALPKIPFP